MNDRQKDWINFVGFSPEHYDGAIGVIKKWQEYIQTHEINKESLTQLNRWLFSTGEAYINHSCCLSYKSLHIDDYNTIVAAWIEGGGLGGVPGLFEKARPDILEADWQYMLADHTVAFFGMTNDYLVLGFTLDGNIVINTKEMYGSLEAQTAYKKTNGDREYYEKFLETVKENYHKLQLPAVPKGILKIPLSI